MAQAIVYTITGVTVDGNDLVFDFPIQFYGTDLARPDQSVASLRVLPADTDTNIQTKWTDAIVNEAVRLGYSVARTAVRIPAYMRGR